MKKKERLPPTEEGVFSFLSSFCLFYVFNLFSLSHVVEMLRNDG